MRSFSDPKILDPVPGAVVRILAEVDRGRGREEFHRERVPSTMEHLAARARINSVVASNEIEDIVVPIRRAETVLAGTSEPRGRSENELAGYQAALDDAFSIAVAPLSVARLIGWHRLLFRYQGPEVAGRLKSVDNVVVDRDLDGRQVERFRPVSARESPSALQELCERYEQASLIDLHHPLVLIAAATLDFLVIHPFEDGNGRVARILTNALASRQGYHVCRYEPLEKFVAERRDSYYDSLQASTVGWHDGEHSVWPWAEFLASTFRDAYRALERDAIPANPEAESQALEDWLHDLAPFEFSISDMKRALPAMSEGTLKRALGEWRGAGRIVLSGKGRGAKWVRVR